MFPVGKSTLNPDGSAFQESRMAHVENPPRTSFGDWLGKPEINSDQDWGKRRKEDLALYHSPPLSETHLLQLATVETFNAENCGLQLSELISYIPAIPQRIGYSAALDNAVACLVNVHSGLIRNNDPLTRIHPQLYSKALRSLQTALHDPVEGFSSNTLCAMTLLGYVEALGAYGWTSNYVKHSGGAARLIRLRGPAKHRTGFDKALLLDQGGAIVGAN